MKFQKVVFVCIFLIMSIPALAQEPATSLQKIAPKIFIDCRWCDIDYIRKDMNFVNHFYDRKNADILSALKRSA